MSISLPNVRKLFIPDEGYTIFDADLEGADAQVVAWEVEDEELKDVFRAGNNIHVKNARDMFPDKVKGFSDEAIEKNKIYKEVKTGVHGTNYGAGSRTLSQIVGWTVADTEKFQSKWFSLHPGIRLWHNRTEIAIRTKRAVRNSFGYSRTYFD